MTSKATTVTLPPTVPGYRPRKAKVVQPTKPVHDFQRWLTAKHDAESSIGYDAASSPIHGKTDVDVITEVRELIGKVQDGTEPSSKLDTVQYLLGEVLKRRIAKQLAGRAYRGK